VNGITPWSFCLSNTGTVLISSPRFLHVLCLPYYRSLLDVTYKPCFPVIAPLSISLPGTLTSSIHHSDVESLNCAPGILLERIGVPSLSFAVSLNRIPSLHAAFTLAIVLITKKLINNFSKTKTKR
jgi:hypothetical protein